VTPTGTTYESTVNYTYDAGNRLRTAVDSISGTITRGYDNLDRLTSDATPQGTVSYTYENAGRRASLTVPGQSVVNYSFDAANRLAQITQGSAVVQFSYDADNRRTSLTLPNGVVTTYSYDTASQLTGMTYTNGSTAFVYDTLNRLQTLTPPSAFSGTGNFGFTYDALSRRTQLTRPNNVATNYTYDPLSHLQSVLHQLSGSTIDGATYAVDATGNRTSKTDRLANVTSNYAYDSIYELTGVTQGGAATTENYTYDAVGNRLTSLNVPSYAYNNSNELTSTSNATYTSDNNGNSLAKTDSTGTTSYTWDFENRLTSLTLPGTGGTVTFKYDTFGRRIQKSSATGTTNYLYDGPNSLEEVDASGNLVARYTHTQNIDEPLAMLRSGATSFYHADGLGSITSLTNSSGALSATYTFDSFGNLASSTGTLTNPFRYTAREFDTETNLYFYRARYLDPLVGRFVREDPIRFQGGINFYAYVGNDPTNHFDSSGNAPDGPCLDMDKFLKWLDDHAQNKSTGRCAQSVRKALEVGGLNTTGHPTLAKDYGPFLLNLGFLGVPQDAYVPQPGDVVVIQPGPTPSGHIQAWDGSQWVSDFNQGATKISPYKGDTPPYAIYRFSKPCS